MIAKQSSQPGQEHRTSNTCPYLNDRTSWDHGLMDPVAMVWDVNNLQMPIVLSLLVFFLTHRWTRLPSRIKHVPF